MATPQDLLLALSRVYDFTETRFSGDPEYVGALEEVRGVHEALGWVVVRVGSGGFQANGEPVPDPERMLISLARALREAGIEEIRFQDPVDPEVLEEFLRRVYPSPGRGDQLPSARFRGLGPALGLSYRGGEGSLPGMAGSVQGLFQAKEAPDGSESETPSPGEEVASSPSALPGERDESLGLPPRPSLPEELDQLVRGFLDVTAPLRSEKSTRIKEAAGEMKEAHDVSGQTELVQRLAESVGAATGDPDILELARDLASPAIASRLVARLGATRDSFERGQLIHVISRLGREGGLALADALVEARDRAQRRTFMDALVAMGDLGLEMADGMADDSRWFVVRNGVAVLGEIGGEEAVTTLTGTLANRDARVRKESVLALAKLGGDNAGILIMGMLDDGDAGVRAAACKGLGALRVARAVKPLVGILEHDDDTDVRVEGLRALGQIGDPGAVPHIEKRALGGLFSRFSRPAREIRIAAYRALAGIGTPHAKSLLQKAATDSDPGVKAVVRSLIGDD